MPNLTERAEQALLGALLIDPGLMAALSLRTTDFGSDLHAAVFYELQCAAESGDREADAADQEATIIGPGYAAELRRSCPDHRNASAYARMVMEAALRRQLREHAERLQTDAANLHYDVRRLEHADSRAGITAGFPAATINFDDAHNGSLALRSVAGHQLKLAVALRSHAKAFDPGRESNTPDPGLSSGPAAEIVVPSAAAATRYAAIQPSSERADPVAEREEHVLAIIVQQDDAARDIPGWLPPAAFAEGPRRQLYQAITSLYALGEPIDQLTVDWEHAKMSAALPPAADASRALDTTYAARLARVAIDADAAMESCNILFRTHVNVADALGNGHRVRPELVTGAARPLAILPPPASAANPEPEPRI